MRINQYMLILFSFIIVQVFSQQQTQMRSDEILEKESSIDLKKHQINQLLDDPKLYSDILNQEKLIQLLESIPYFEIRKYPEEINKIYALYATDSSNNQFCLKSLKSKALLSYQLRDYNQAISEFQKYFNDFKRIYNVDTSFAFEYSKYASCLLRLGKEKEFLLVIDSAINTANKKGNPYNDLAIGYYTAGEYFSNKRQLDTARLLLNKARTYINKSPNKDLKVESQIFMKQGFLETLNMNFDLAIIQYTASMEALLATDHTDLEIATLYRERATAYYMNNQIVDAIKHYKMALYIYEKELAANHPAITSTYRYLGLAHSLLGHYQEAIKDFQKSINLDPSDQNFYTYRNLADTYSTIDSLDMAEELYNKCLKIVNESMGPEEFQTAFTYLKFGQFLLEKKTDSIKGIEYVNNTISIYYKIFKGKIPDLVYPLTILGTHYINNKQFDRGLDSLQSALIIANPDFNSRDIYTNPETKNFLRRSEIINTYAWKAYGFLLKYQSTKDISDLSMSFQTYNDFIDLAKETRKYYEDTESLMLGAQLDYVFGQAVHVANLLHQNTNDPYYIDKIFEFIEGKKSYTLFSSLSILEKKKLLNVPKELLKKEAELKYQMGIINEKINIEKAGKSNIEILNSLDQSAFQMSLSLDSIQESYKNDYSGFYNLKYGFKELSLQDAQNKTKENQAFLNYAISDSMLTILCITKENVNLINRKMDPDFFSEIKTLVRLLKNVNTDESYSEFKDFITSSRNLYKALIEPVEPFIKNKELIIVPDGEISYVAFDALLSSDIKMDRPDYRKLPYLIKNHKTSVANSMQIYFNMKSKKRESSNQVYAFAPKYQNPNDTTGLPPEYQYLRPLDYADLEVNSIANYFPTELFIGEQASEENFIEQAKNASILHLAMHTIINDNEPLYSKLLFSYHKDDKSGLVNTYELLTMNLNAELAVLSGCSTGEGELQKGEGVMSLSSGFQYAGVPAIVMSLWEVNDRFGALVIDKFYQYLADGLPKNEALYQAKLEVLLQGNALYAHPYYWAGLTLMGDDSRIQINQKLTEKYVIFFFVFLAISYVLLYLFKRKI